MAADECRLCAKLRSRQPTKSPWMFTSKTGLVLTRDGVTKALATVCAIAKLEIPFHHHMLRHSCGYALTAQGNDTRLIQEYLGHRSIEQQSDIPRSTRRGSRVCGKNSGSASQYRINSPLFFHSVESPIALLQLLARHRYINRYVASKVRMNAVQGTLDQDLEI